MDVSAVLARRTADVLVRDGWSQGVARDDRGHLCLLGAMDVVQFPGRFSSTAGGGSLDWLPGLGDSSEWAQFRWQFCHYLGVESTEGLWRWNDESHRTAEQVIKELRAFADSREART